MNKDISDIRESFNNAIAGTYDKNERVIYDQRFAFVHGEQWAGSYEKEFAHKPKPENNKVAKAINRILGQYERLEMNAKIMSNSDDATDEDAELLQSRWRNDFGHSDGVEALNNAAKEAFSGGFGAFKLVAKYEDEENPDPQKQYLCVEPIYSAASSVVYNAGAIKKDKSDAKQCWQLLRVNRRDIEDEYDKKITPFPHATHDYFDWNCLGSDKDVYIAHYWEVKNKTYTVFDFNDGEFKVERRGRKYFDQNNAEVDKEDFDAIKELTPYSTYKRKVKEVWYSLMDGSQYLIEPQKTPFKRIPVIPQYGYHTVLDGIEYYCGEVAGQRDPQMFENMFFSSLMEILSERQVAIPEYLPEQVEGDIGRNIANEKSNNSAYRVTLPVEDNNGNIIQSGPVGRVDPPQIGTGMATAGQYLLNAQNEQAGTGQSTLPANASGDAVRQVNERADDSYQPLFQNAMQAIKALCQTWIPAAQKLYFNTQRRLRVMSENGSYSQVDTMEYGNDDMGNYGPVKNTARGKYDVQVKIGESYKGKKEAERQASLEILQFAGTDSEIGQMALNAAIKATTGEGTESIRKIARFKEIDMLMSMGIDPNVKTDEEQQYAQRRIAQMQQQAQNPQVDPNVMIAQAEQMKAQADLLKAQDDARDTEIDAYNAQTKRMEAIIKADKADADISKTNMETMSKATEMASNAPTGLTVVSNN